MFMLSLCCAVWAVGDGRSLCAVVALLTSQAFDACSKCSSTSPLWKRIVRSTRYEGVISPETIASVTVPVSHAD